MGKCILMSIIVIFSLSFISCNDEESMDKVKNNDNLGVVEKEFNQIVEDDIGEYSEKSLDLSNYSLENGYSDTANTTFLWFRLAHSEYGYYFENQNQKLSRPTNAVPAFSPRRFPPHRNPSQIFGRLLPIRLRHPY